MHIHSSAKHPMCFNTPLSVPTHSKATSRSVLPMNSRPPFFRKWPTSHLSLDYWFETWALDSSPTANYCGNAVLSAHNPPISESVFLVASLVLSCHIALLLFELSEHSHSALSGISGGTLSGWEVSIGAPPSQTSLQSVHCHGYVTDYIQ